MQSTGPRRERAPLGRVATLNFNKMGWDTHINVCVWGEELYIVNLPICQVPDHKQGLIYFLGKAMPMPCVLRHPVRTQVHKING